MRTFKVDIVYSRTGVENCPQYIWCRENLEPHNYIYDWWFDEIKFFNDEDSVAFKLRFGDD